MSGQADILISYLLLSSFILPLRLVRNTMIGLQPSTMAKATTILLIIHTRVQKLQWIIQTRDLCTL